MPSCRWPVVLALAPGTALTILFVTMPAGSAFPSAQGAAPLTYARDVAPIIRRNCVTCHRPGEVAPFSLLTYDDVRQRAQLIAEALEKHEMPPWQPESECCEFEGDRRLPDEDIRTLRRWVEEGAVRGDPAAEPPPPVFTEGWQLGKPDLALIMDKPFVVPADGPDVFHNFVLHVPVNRRRFVAALEFRPGNARVLHHARVMVDDSGESRRRDGERDSVGFEGMEAPGARFPEGHFIGWAPGKVARRETFPWPIEAGTDLVIQMHLKPTGREETIRASIGLHFTDRPPAITPAMLRMGSRTIDIAPGEREYAITDRFVLPVDATVVRIYPHAHYLARTMSVTARLPATPGRDVQIRGLFHIDEWDFNWQDEYVYRTPLSLPRGSTIELRYTYDNSSANPRNPHDPPVRVRTGPYATDEMGELLVQLLAKTPADAATLRGEVARKSLEAEIAGEEKRVQDVPDDFRVRNALGVHYVQAGRLLDAVAQFERSLALEPGHAVAHYNLGVIAMQRDQPAQAAAHFERAIAARPSYVEAHTNFGALLARTGDPRGARQQYEAALATHPDHVPALNNFARLLATADDLSVADPGAAVARAERANRLAGGQNLTVLDTLSLAYAADGQIEPAIRAARTALERAMETGNEALAAAFRRRVLAYESAR